MPIQPVANATAGSDQGTGKLSEPAFGVYANAMAAMSNTLSSNTNIAMQPRVECNGEARPQPLLSCNS